MISQATLRSQEDIALSISGRPYLSYSQLSTFCRCPLKFKFQYVDQVDSEFQPSTLVFGISFHKALEAYFIARMFGQNMALEDLLFTYQNSWRELEEGADVKYSKGENFDSLHVKCKGMLGAFLRSESAGLHPVGIEETVEAELDPFLPPILARLDLISLNGESLTLTDFKTSRARWSGFDAIAGSKQLHLYAAILAKAQDMCLSHMQFIVATKTKVPEIQVVSATFPQPLDQLLEGIKKVWHAMKLGIDFANPNIMNCAGCQFKSHCRFSAA